MNACATPDLTFTIPISSGLLAHCPRIGIAIWVFLWMINRTTIEVPTPDGYAEGLVYNGKAIRAQEIALDLQMATRTVHAHLERLIAGGYLRRLDKGVGMPSGYAVTRSKKWKSRLALAPLEEPEAASPNSAHPRRKTACGSHDSALPSQDSALPSPIPAPYKEDITRTIQGLNIVEGKNLDETPVLVLSSTTVKDDLEALVKDGWLYFLERADKSPAQHQFTRDKQQLGLKGFKALLDYAKRSHSAEPFEAVPGLFRLAVDRLAESPFHNGENERGKSYLDWHQLFRSKDFPAPRKLVEFWLDDKKWGSK